MQMFTNFRLAMVSAAAVAFAGALQPDSASAQLVEVQAFAGEPLGVARITVRFPPGRQPPIVRGQPLWLDEAHDRALYPVYNEVVTRTETANKKRLPQAVEAYFLFRGSDPLELTFDIADSHRATAVPANDPAAHKTLLNEWWQAGLSAAQEQAQTDAGPPQIENYLTAMLSRRLKLPPPQVVHAWSGRGDVDTIFGTLLGAESIRLAMQKDTFLKESPVLEEAGHPLPKPAELPAIALPELPDEIAIESIARHVPAECFYLRCGSFSNFQWLRRTVETWGGNLRDLVAVRGLDYDIRGRLERQLALRETALSSLLGEAVIADVALVGADTFFREGAAVGVLFEARNSAVLAAALAAQRQDAVKNRKGLHERTVEISGHKVSLLAASDNAVRSFYAVDGDFHLVTTSQMIVRRFYEAGAGKDSLAGLEEFRYARTLMPVARQDSLFVYLSDPWFRLLVSPQYRIEMTRRMQAEAEVEIVHLARLAARAEKQPAETIEQLIAGGFLPKWFGHRSDGSRPVLAEGDVIDSLRGARRSFLPIPDVAINGVTPTELKSYTDFAQYYASQWQRVDPVIAGIKREQRQTPRGRREGVVLDLHITPYARQHYDIFARFLGPPGKKRLAPVPGNVFDAEVRMRSPYVDGRGRAASHMFAGLRDFPVSFVFREGHVLSDTDFADERLPGYLGSTPAAAGLLFRDSKDIPEGYSEGDATFWARWTRKFNDFVVEAKSKAVLEAVTGHLKLEQAERAAQLRVHVADLAAAQVGPFLNALGYERSRAASAGNVSFMHALMQQFRVAPEAARDTMQSVLAASPACPLGGAYRLNEHGPGPVRWYSTGWSQEYPGNENRLPAEFQFPFLKWFHGLDLEFSIDATTLTTRFELELEPVNAEPPSAAKSE